MKLFMTILLPLILLVNIHASDDIIDNDVSVGYGSSVEDIDIYRISLKKDLNPYFFEKRYKFLPKYYEGSFGYWEGKNGKGLVNLSFTPVFRYTNTDLFNVDPFIEGGLGATYISKSKLQDENFGQNFQFESFIGIGVKTDNFEFTYRYMHYSNLVHEHNSGVTLGFISITYSF